MGIAEIQQKNYLQLVKVSLQNSRKCVGEWKYGSSHFLPRHYQKCCQPHAMARERAKV